MLLSAWHLNGASKVWKIPLPFFQGLEKRVECVYPKARPVSNAWKKTEGVLEVELSEAGMARMFRISRG